MAILKSRESLAIKYRPKRLEQFIGQEEVISILKGQFKSKAINRSFLLHGASGVGKTSLGRVMAHYLNCENFDYEACAPCSVCSYCKDVDEKNYYGGVEEINFSDSRGVDVVRSIIESTVYAPEFNAKVFICDEVQCLPALSQNAFLKILEEPPDGVVFLFLTTDPQKLLNTVHNRCCSLALDRVDADVIAKHLLKVAKLEKREYFAPKEIPEDPKEAKEATKKSQQIYKNIALISNGYVRQALATLEAVLSMVEGGEKIDGSDAAVVKRIAGRFNLETPDTEVSIAQYLIKGIYSGRYGLALSYALKLINVGHSTKFTFEKVMDYHMQTMFYMADPNRKIANLTEEFYRSWYASLIGEVKKPNGLMVTHLAAAEIVNIMLDLVTQLATFAHDERRLLVAYTIRMIDAVNKYKHLSYTKASVFHKTHAPELLRTVEPS